MTETMNFADTQSYLQHFRDRDCDPEIIGHIEGIINLFWCTLAMTDELKQELEKKQVNIARLQEIIFGQARHHEDTPNEKAPQDEGKKDQEEHQQDEESKKRKGHGRRGADDYPGAETVACPHEHYSAGEFCPLCKQGRLKSKPPVVRIQFDGAVPLQATRYELEQLVCTHCTFTTSAALPQDPSEKYTKKAKATLAVIHYGMGLPYYRLAKLQAMLGMPIAVSTQSELIASMMGPIHPLFNHLVFSAAQREQLYQDDTGVLIQSLLKENKVCCPDRTGMYTSGFVAEGDHTIVLYFSGRAHAGENFDQIMSHREVDQGMVIRMADALAANSKHTADAIEAKCNAHAFRRFRSLLSRYPEASFVLQIYGQVYEHDEFCKNQQFNNEERLAYHQTHSEPLMDELNTWARQGLSGDVEPNSPLGIECQYLLTHWAGLTQFLKVPGAPLDNNKLEATLKYMITYRKNSQMFKTVYSADYGSRLLSLIVTCMINHINAIDYLTQLQIHESRVWRDPSAWTPWQYQQTLRQMAQCGNLGQAA